ncbi:MAG: YeiH family protein [Methyloligellaceae bacterium]
MSILSTDELKPGNIKNSIKVSIASASVFWPGIVISGCIAFTALFLSSHYGAPAFLFALLVGISVNFVRHEKTFTPGIEITSKSVLRIGVALLGFRIGLDEIYVLGLPAIIITLTALIATILMGLLISRLLGQSFRLGLLVGGATAICGASATLAISSCLPHYQKKESDTLFTVVIVTTLSTVAMALYPVLASWLKFNDVQAGFFIGATIHDVAQVVGAGYSISHQAGDIAIVTKLLRVASLVPIISALAFLLRTNDAGSGSGRTRGLPLFLIAFVIFATANSLHLVPAVVTETTNHLSRFLLIMAVAAIGTKTYLGDIVKTGWKAFLLAILTTLFLALIVVGGIEYFL